MSYTGQFPLPVVAGGTSQSIVPTNGQILIGGSSSPAWASLTAGSGITITPASHGITITNSGGGSGISTLDGDSGSATGATVTLAGGSNITTSASSATVTIDLDNSPSITGTFSLPNTDSGGVGGIINFGGSPFIQNFGNNIFIGGAGNLTLVDGVAAINIGIGNTALRDLTGGDSNVAVGNAAMRGATSDEGNVAIGAGSMAFSTGTFFNTCIGYAAMNGGSGNYNVVLGYNAAQGFSGSESNNIIIGSASVSGGINNTIYIGDSGSGTQQQNRCFIAGIFGVTVGVSGIPVVIDNAGQLGTVVSSLRFKENIEDIDLISSKIYGLNPVSFIYKEQQNKIKNFGLIAEEVEQVIPELVVYNENLPFTVKYQEIIPLLLNEIKKLNTKIENLEKTINQ